MMNRNEEAHAACLNILSDNKDSAPRIAELCTLSRLLGSEVDAITAERDEFKRRCQRMTYKLGNSPLPTEDGWRKWYQNMYASLKSIAEGRDNG